MKIRSKGVTAGPRRAYPSVYSPRRADHLLVLPHGRSFTDARHSRVRCATLRWLSDSKVETTVERFDRVDVLINNAG
jgi:NADP-dependent 3-hydroxy acid dehydrogenase YdfG